MPDASAPGTDALIDDPLGRNGGWRTAERPTLGGFAGSASQLLRDLRPLHPDRERVMLGRRSPSQTLSPWGRASAVTQWALQQPWEPRPAITSRYERLDGEGRPTAASRRPLGFRLSLSGRGQGRERLLLTVSDSGLDGGGVGRRVPAARVDEHSAAGMPEALREAVPRQRPAQSGATGTRAWNEAVQLRDPGWVTREVGGYTFRCDATLAEAVAAGLPAGRLGSGIVLRITPRPDRPSADELGTAIALRTWACSGFGPWIDTKTSVEPHPWTELQVRWKRLPMHTPALATPTALPRTHLMDADDQPRRVPDRGAAAAGDPAPQPPFEPRDADRILL